MTDPARPVGDVRNLADGIPETPAPNANGDTLGAVLRHPYTLATWRADLAALREGVDTGFPALADVGLQWQPGRVYSVIARPGAGKTTFLLEACCRYLEAHPEAHAVFLSWEEPLADVVTSLLMRADAKRESPEGTAYSSEVLHPSTAKEWGHNGASVKQERADRLTRAAEKVEPLLARLHLIDGDRLGHTARAVLAALAAWMREANAPPVGLVAVDYFQKLTGERDRSRQVELQGVADALRRFAKGARLSGEDGDAADALDTRLAVPVLVGAQVNRTNASGGGNSGHPTGDDIREADDLLNDSAGVIALSWQLHQTEPSGEEIRTLQLSVPKNRGGATKGEHSAGMLWRPARRFLALDALRDGARVRWQLIQRGESSERRKSQLNTPPFAGDPNA